METIQSESIGKLASALCAVQKEIGGAKKDSRNPFFNSNYADLGSCWETCRKLLTDNGLCVIQTNGGTAEAPSVITTLAHTSGEWIRGELAMAPDKKGPQGIGSCVTYARRYALASIVGMYQVDDDAEGATDREEKSNGKKYSDKKTGSGKTITDKQIGFLVKVAKGKDMGEAELADYVMENWSIEKVGDIPMDDFNDILAHVKEIEATTDDIPLDDFNDIPF